MKQRDLSVRWALEGERLQHKTVSRFFIDTSGDAETLLDAAYALRYIAKHGKLPPLTPPAPEQPAPAFNVGDAVLHTGKRGGPAQRRKIEDRHWGDVAGEWIYAVSSESSSGTGVFTQTLPGIPESRLQSACPACAGTGLPQSNPAPAPRVFAVGDRVVVAADYTGGAAYPAGTTGTVYALGSEAGSCRVRPDAGDTARNDYYLHSALRPIAEQYPRACKYEPGSGWYTTRESHSLCCIIGYTGDGYKIRFKTADIRPRPLYDDELTPLPAPWPVEVAA